jgi:hypothetical protein
MKNTILAVSWVISMFAMQDAAGVVSCDHYTLRYSEEVPEDGPEEVYSLLEPLANGYGDIPF